MVDVVLSTNRTDSRLFDEKPNRNHNRFVRGAVKRGSRLPIVGLGEWHHDHVGGRGGPVSADEDESMVGERLSSLAFDGQLSRVESNVAHKRKFARIFGPIQAGRATPTVDRSTEHAGRVVASPVGVSYLFVEESAQLCQRWSQIWA